jgi:hypothetical protein
MKGIFEILVKGKIETYHDYSAIPMTFDNLIKFEPEFHEGPHTPEQHEQMSQYNNMLKELMKREKSYAGNN